MIMNSLMMIAVVVATPIAVLAQTPGTDPLAYSGPAWSPYLVGALIGVLSWLTFYFSNKPLGASTAYASLAGLVGKAVVRRKTESLQFYRETPPKRVFTRKIRMGQPAVFMAIQKIEP